MKKVTIQYQIQSFLKRGAIFNPAQEQGFNIPKAPFPRRPTVAFQKSADSDSCKRDRDSLIVIAAGESLIVVTFVALACNSASCKSQAVSFPRI